MTTTTILDLHDLAAILLHEWSLTEPNFLHSRLLEVTDGSKPKKALPSHVSLPLLDEQRRNLRNLRAYFVKDEDKKNTPISEFDFKDKDFTSATPYSDTDIETMFWQIKHHDHGYALAHAMQIVLGTLPKTIKQLRIRTSQGYSVLAKPHEFAIAEIQVLPKQPFYICQLGKQPGLKASQVAISQYVTGADGYMPWVYLLFGGKSVWNSNTKLDGRVALDLAAPLLSGMRGLGKEVFAMEKMVDYHDNVLPEGGIEHPSEIQLSGRISTGARQDEVRLASSLARKVLDRVKGIIAGEKNCGYCGRNGATSACGGCKQTKYCDKRCQTNGWKYHKKWCKVDAAAAEGNNA
jgi:hypothetical protein